MCLAAVSRAGPCVCGGADCNAPSKTQTRQRAGVARRGGGRWFSQMWVVERCTRTPLLGWRCWVGAGWFSPGAALTRACVCIGGRSFDASSNTLMFDPSTGGQGGEGMTNANEWWIENVLETLLINPGRK